MGLRDRARRRRSARILGASRLPLARGSLARRTLRVRHNGPLATPLGMGAAREYAGLLRRARREDSRAFFRKRFEQHRERSPNHDWRRSRGRGERGCVLPGLLSERWEQDSTTSTSRPQGARRASQPLHLLPGRRAELAQKQSDAVQPGSAGLSNWISCVAPTPLTQLKRRSWKDSPDEPGPTTWSRKNPAFPWMATCLPQFGP